MSDYYKAISQMAGLDANQKAQIDGLFKSLATHKELLGLPSDLAKQRYQQLPAEQQQLLTKMYGEDEQPDKNRGWLQSAAHYAKAGLSQTIGRVFGAMREGTDFMTRVYRAGAIYNDQNLDDFGKAWDIANDKGNKVFRPAAIADAKGKYGADRVDIAMRIASGESWKDVFGNATDAQKAIISEYRNNKGNGLLQDALTAVEQSKYSFGRDLASAMGLRGTGAYKWVSGLGDLTYLLVTDPTLNLGRAKKAWDVTHYSLEVIKSKGKVAEVFEKPQVKAFWDKYGGMLGQLEELQSAAKTEGITAAERTKKLAEAAAIRTQMTRLAPEFGETSIAEFTKIGIRNAQDAANYFKNSDDFVTMMRGQAARNTPLMPRLNAGRKIRVGMYTATDKVFNLNVVGRDFLSAAYLSDEVAGVDDIVTGIIQNPVSTGEKVKKALATTRWTDRQVWQRLDSFARKFNKIPHGNKFIDLMDPEATTQVYRLASVALPRYHAKLAAEEFAASDIGRKMDIWKGLWQTVGAIQGANKTSAGQEVLAKIAGSMNRSFAARVTERADDGTVIGEFTPGVIDDVPHAIGLWQTDTTVAFPSLAEIQQIAARDGIFGRILGFSHNKWISDITSYWSFLTLAGPRYAIRNATEDLMVHMVSGGTPWGFAKGRWVSNAIRLANEGHDVGVINKFVHWSRRDAYRKELEGIRMIQGISDEARLNLQRDVLARAVVESKFARLLSDEEIAIVKDQIRYTGVGALDEVNEGAMNAARGTDNFIRATQLQRETGGSVAEVTYSGASFGKKGFGEFAPGLSTANRVSYLETLGHWTKDPLGRVALPLMDGKKNEVAIYALADYLRKHPDIRSKFRLYEKEGITEEVHAEWIVKTLQNLFSKSDGKFNDDLFNKIVVNGEVKITKLGLDDLPKTSADLPAFVSGPQYIPIAEAGNVTSSVIDRGWRFLGDMNARYSREPIVWAEQIRIRKAMRKDGSETRMIAALKSNGLTEEAAMKRVAEIVQERAIAKTLAYVDNPAIQTQMAFNMRNFARFYRATEDFYRRAVRTVRYNPEALAKASLTYDGISHSGWIQEDANGEQYFLYPGMAPVYKAVMGAFSVLGMGTAFKAPLPVQFGGRLNMVTPSLNPDSLMPTFAGPLAAFSVKSMANVIGWWDPTTKNAVETTFLGPYAQNQSMLSALLPSHINRAYAALNRDDRNSQWASAFRKAITYAEAAGLAPKPTVLADGTEVPPSPAELEKYKDTLTNMTSAVLATRFVFGFFAPASPQIDYKSDMSTWVRKTGISSWKQGWTQLLEKYDGDYDRAMADWAKYFPTELPYTVSENESQVVNYIRASDKAGAFVENNKALFEKYREGASFLIPVDGEFTYDAWRTLKNNNFYAPKAVGDFLREVQASGDYAFYKEQQRDYETRLAASGFDFEKKQLRETWESWSKDFKAARPMLQAQLSSFADTRARKTAALTDLQALLADKSVKVSPKTRAALREMNNLYLRYAQLKSYSENSTFADMELLGIRQQMKEIAGSNPSVGAAYSSLFSYLMGD